MLKPRPLGDDLRHIGVVEGVQGAVELRRARLGHRLHHDLGLLVPGSRSSGTFQIMVGIKNAAGIAARALVSFLI